MHISLTSRITRRGLTKEEKKEKLKPSQKIKKGINRVAKKQSRKRIPKKASRTKRTPKRKTRKVIPNNRRTKNPKRRKSARTKITRRRETTKSLQKARRVIYAQKKLYENTFSQKKTYKPKKLVTENTYSEFIGRLVSSLSNRLGSKKPHRLFIYIRFTLSRSQQTLFVGVSRESLSELFTDVQDAFFEKMIAAFESAGVDRAYITETWTGFVTLTKRKKAKGKTDVSLAT